jgi:indolepyruvate ferredoxin oxidoreductase beta subunit
VVGLERPINILIVGVGGQGTILASELLAHVLMTTGYDVKKSEVHGMSQRGGRVESHVRFGQKVYSPLIVRGEVDYLVGFELGETLRSLDWIDAQGKVITDTKAVLPYTSQVGEAPYPFDAVEKIRERGHDLIVVEGERMAGEAGDARTANIVLIGALARLLPVKRDHWEKGISDNMPEKFVETNLKAFRMGYEHQGERGR